MYSKLKKRLDGFLFYGLPGYDVAVMRDGELVCRITEGYRDLAKTKPLDGTEHYNLYSCSKLITVTAALLLLERGIIRLDDPVSDYLPAYGSLTVKQKDGSVAPAKNVMRVFNLFTMTAGLAYPTTGPWIDKVREETNGRCPTVEAMQALASVPLEYEPGESWLYSQGHDVLAAVVEVASGMRFGEFVKREIFLPLGMHDSTFLLPSSELSQVTDQFRFTPAGIVDVGHEICGYKLGSEYESGGAGCVSTMHDYLLFLEALRTDKILAPETARLMTTPQLDEKMLAGFSKRSPVLCDMSYGYGLGVRCPLPGSKTVSDFGWGGAAGAFAAVDKSLGYSLFYLQHALNSPFGAKRTPMIGDLPFARTATAEASTDTHLTY